MSQLVHQSREYPSDAAYSRPHPPPSHRPPPRPDELDYHRSRSQPSNPQSWSQPQSLSLPHYGYQPNNSFNHLPHTPVTPTTPAHLDSLASPSPSQSQSPYHARAQDSPTIGRPHLGRSHHAAHSSPKPSPINIVPVAGTAPGSSTLGSSSPTSPLSSTGARFRKPAPSPLHNTTAISPPNSPSPVNSTFNHSFGTYNHHVSTPTATSTSAALTPTWASAQTESGSHSPQLGLKGTLELDQSYHKSHSSGIDQRDDKLTTGSASSFRLPNEARSVSDPVKKPTGVLPNAHTRDLPGSSRMETVKGAPRNSSIDSAVSAISTGSSSKNAPDASNPADVAKLVKAAGSPEAVIKYLLKEKQSHAQQNAQLWRLVDKQRAMILGLNKDLERALKDKEKYRKKMKEVLSLQTTAPNPSALEAQSAEDGFDPSSDEKQSPSQPKPLALNIPASPSVASDSKPSPIDVALAPYPITPPADQVSNGPPSAVGEILDPSHAMPEASEHALDRFDHEADERHAEAMRMQADDTNDLPLNTPIPPNLISSEPRPLPQGSPPAPPQQVAQSEISPSSAHHDSLSQFPSPPQPPPRKPPPAPLQLVGAKSSAVSDDEDSYSDSDLDRILEDDAIDTHKRGRRRTRHEDEQMREILALKEAEARSLSKKGQQNSSAKASPRAPVLESQIPLESPIVPLSILNFQNGHGSVGSLTGILKGGGSDAHMSLQSSGLPASPRPVSVVPGPTSPPLSPRQSAAAPLSPRAPRQPIPLPPNTPLQTPSPHEPVMTKAPKPLDISKTQVPNAIDSPASSHESTIERTRIYKGFITEEYPDLLIPPNALSSIAVKVASSRMKPSRASLISLTQLEEDPVFTLAVMSKFEGGELWRVEKDSMSLAKLDSRLKQCPEFTARTPDRTLFTGHAPAKLDARRVALDLYFDELVNCALDTNTAMELCKYLSSNVLPPNADEMGSSVGLMDEGATKVGPGGREFKSGYLTKRGKNFGGWKARFFVVEGPLLKYYETPGGAHLGTIKLQGAKIGRQSHQNDTSTTTAISDEADNQYRHAFLILEPKKKDPSAMTKHVLCAESDKERDRWVNVLLPWINYKEPADQEKKRESTRDHQDSNSVKGPNTKKKTYGSSKSQQHQASEDKLIGVSYENTRQGESPSTEQAEAPGPAVTSQLKTISAPRDPQLIADAGMWTNKMSLNPPGIDEKKARKRSFFGFGSKQTISSSEGSDSLFGDINTYNGPIRKVFGAPLSEAVRFNTPRDVRVPLPAVVYRCIQYLDGRGAVTEEGIFRLSGSNLVIKALKERFDNEGDINLLAEEQYHDIHAVASMLKAYLRELPTSILTRDLHLEFVAVTEMNNQAEKIAALHELVQRLPQGNATLLKYLIAFLIKIINHSDKNKMTVRNVGIVFSPTLTIPAPVFALFLQNYQAIFGIAPEEYELPSPMSEERHTNQYADLPPRPSTSERMRESPHRQRLAEALAEQRRGNTPPPGTSVNPLGGFPQSRTTFTPPPGQPRYEVNQYAQHNLGSQVSLRPAYESMAFPVGFDPSQGYPAPQAQRAAYDQPPGYRASRRESSMMVGSGLGPQRGVTPQGSSSRLRETQF